MVSPITYPLRPLNGGNLDKPNAIIPPWPRAYEPKVNGWRVLVHAPSGACWNRHLEPLSIAGEFAAALAKLKEQPFAWLDCEALSRRHGIGKGSLIVLDINGPPVASDSYVVRRKSLELHFPNEITLFPSSVKENEVYRLPSLTSWHGKWPEATWRIMQAQNKAAGLAGENVFFEGLVCKRLDSKYPLQLRSDTDETTVWIKHRFV